MKELKLRAERKKRQRSKNTTKWVAYKTLSKNLPPYNAELMQHVIHHFGIGSLEGMKFECEEHSWRDVRKDKHAEAEPFIYPEDVPSTYQISSLSVFQSHASPK